MLAERAAQGNERCRAELERRLETQPEIWQAVGDVASVSEKMLIEQLAGGNQLAEVSIRRNLAARTLVTRRSHTLGLIGFETTLFGPALMLYGIEQAARAAELIAAWRVSHRTGSR